MPDTVKRVRDGRVRSRPSHVTDSSAVQTPQAFRADGAAAAHRIGGVDTDDAALVEANGGVVAIVEGERRNLKLPWPTTSSWRGRCSPSPDESGGKP